MRAGSTSGAAPASCICGGDRAYQKGCCECKVGKGGPVEAHEIVLLWLTPRSAGDVQEFGARNLR
jgi:hypothetical protein